MGKFPATKIRLALYLAAGALNMGTLFGADTVYTAPTLFTTPVTNAGGDTITNESSLTNTSALTNDAGAVISNTQSFQNGQYLYNAGTVTNTGSAVNTGVWTNASGGLIADNASFDNESAGVFDNAGAFVVGTSDGAENNGAWTNESGGLMANAGSFYNYGSLTNAAGAVIGNSGYFENDGFFADAGSFTNTAGVDNFGVWVNEDGGRIVNSLVFFNIGSLENLAGATIVNAGTFTNSGSLTNSGTFSGGSLSNESGGTLTNQGVLDLGGTFTQAAGGKLVIAVAPQGASGLTVSGTASLAGTLGLVYAPGVYTARTYTLLSAAGGVSGTFSDVTQSSPYASGTAVYAADRVSLDVKPLDVAPEGDAVFGALNNLALADGNRTNDSLLRRLDGLEGGPDAEGAEDTPKQSGAWESDTGYTYHMAAGGALAGYTALGGGLAAGLDHRWGRATGGFSVSDGETEVRPTDGESGSLSDPGANLYGALDLGSARVEAAAGYAYEAFTASRAIAAMGETASSSYAGEGLSGAIQAALPLSVAGLSLEPKLGLRYARLAAAGFVESGASSFDLGVAACGVDALNPYVGASLANSFGFGAWNCGQSVDLGWSYEMLDEDMRGTAVAGGGSFALPGQTPSPGEFTVGYSLQARVTEVFSLDAAYRATPPAGNVLEQTLSLAGRYAF